MADKVNPTKFDPTPKSFESDADHVAFCPYCSKCIRSEKVSGNLRAAASLARRVYQLEASAEMGDIVSRQTIKGLERHRDLLAREVAELRDELSELRNNNLRGMELERNRFRQQAEAAERERDAERERVKALREALLERIELHSYKGARCRCPSCVKSSAALAATADKGEDNG